MLFFVARGSGLTHWGRVTHICVIKLTIIGSDNGLSPVRRQAIIWTNAEIMLIGPLGTNFSEILIEIFTFSFKKMRLKMSSGKWRPSCLGLNVLKALWQFQLHIHHSKYRCALLKGTREMPISRMSYNDMNYSLLANVWSFNPVGSHCLTNHPEEWTWNIETNKFPLTTLHLNSSPLSLLPFWSRGR